MQQHQTAEEEITNIQDQLKEAHPGDILLFYHATGMSRIIPLLTRSPFFHVGIYAGGTDVLEARPTGVTRRDLCRVEEDDVHHFVVIPAPQDKGRHALDWAQSCIGGSYDATGAVVMVLERLFRIFHINYATPDKWTCGEFVAAAFDQAGVRLFPDYESEEVNPGDFVQFLPDNDVVPLTSQHQQKQIVAMAMACIGLAVLWLGARHVRNEV